MAAVVDARIPVATKAPETRTSARLMEEASDARTPTAPSPQWAAPLTARVMAAVSAASRTAATSPHKPTPTSA